MLIVNSVPEIGYDVPSAIVVASINDRNVNRMIAPTKKEYRERNKGVHAIFSQLNELEYIDIIGIDMFLCDDDYCKVMFNGRSLYRDDDHLSTYGSEYITSAFNNTL